MTLHSKQPIPGTREFPPDQISGLIQTILTRAVGQFALPSLDHSKLLCEFILPAAYDAKRGTYVPLTHKVGHFPGTVAYRSKRIARKFTAIGRDILQIPMNPCFFANGLSVPEAFGTPFFDTLSASPPKDRVANVGFIVTTLEFDCRTPAEFADVVRLVPSKN